MLLLFYIYMIYKTINGGRTYLLQIDDFFDKNPM